MKNSAVILSWSSHTSPIPGVWPATHRALLPVCGKPVIIHNLECLSSAGHKVFHIPRGPEQRAVRARLRDGTEWGVSIRYSDLSSDELMNVNLARSINCMLVKADTLDACFAENSCCQDDRAAKTHSSNLEYYGPGYWQHLKPGILQQQVLGEGPIIQTPTAFHRTNLSALCGDFAVTIPGTPIHRHNAHADWNSEISKSAYIGSNVFLGKHVLVGAHARLERDCIVSNGVVIGENVTLKNVTVLPNTYIPSHSTFDNAVLCQTGYFPVHESDLKHSEFIQSNVLSPSRKNSSSSTQ